jgi:hypothetical protein
VARQAGSPDGPGRRKANIERSEVCHVPLHDDLLLLLALFRARLRLHVLRLLQHDGGAYRRGALLLRQRVRLHRLHLPAELRLWCVTHAEARPCAARVTAGRARLSSRALLRVGGDHQREVDTAARRMVHPRGPRGRARSRLPATLSAAQRPGVLSGRLAEGLPEHAGEVRLIREARVERDHR